MGLLDFIIEKALGIPPERLYRHECNFENALNGDNLPSLPPGTPVFCYFTFRIAEHSGICVGKNIVHLLLENYGFQVIDLGKDVPPQTILDKVQELHAPIAGLSALMTTTVGAMEETIALVHKNAPWCKVIVGGAVLTQEYADNIQADKYARDAMESVRICTAWSEQSLQNAQKGRKN